VPDRSATSHLETGKGLPIKLIDVTKTYPGMATNAVDEISMDIEAGEIVVLVGPSGCGKTTTMRMINRLIEPTSGRIVIGDDDVMGLNEVELRRRIGYVIQQIGLFPHLTVAANVALVPRMLKWDKRRIAERVDELLALVGLEPDDFRDRFPRQLSGGQQQRVGVARALAADPPLMLMDEPFGAVDPITRERLQNEFLGLQEQLKKTIVFVTHDFDEAIKMGDRIAVLRIGSHIAQFATPEEILRAPADDFVAGFVGDAATLKSLALHRLTEDDLSPPVDAQSGLPEVALGASLRDAVDAMLESGRDVVRVMDDGQCRGSVRMSDLLARGSAAAANGAAARSGSRAAGDLSS
jgi:osmoprotectant transport system ATP-binding protein